MENKRLVIVGGGPAGMMAAIAAAEQADATGQPLEIRLLEKMPRVGRKLRITGKGRGNVTNAASVPEIIANIPGNGRFLNSAIRAFDNEAVQDFFRAADVPLKVERGNRVFPVSDSAEDLVTALLARLHELAVNVSLETPAAGIVAEHDAVTGVKLRGGETLAADAVIVATGGVSYPATGSAGDAYPWAEKLGHRVVAPVPALVPLETEEDWPLDAQGLSLKNVRGTLYADGKSVGGEFGEMLFTHFGVSGPIILRLSRAAGQYLAHGAAVELAIDLKPALTEEQVNARLLRDLAQYQNRNMKNALRDILPGKLIEPLLDLAYIDPAQPVHQLTKEARQRLAGLLKKLPLTITKTRPLAEAIVTAGGVDTKEIDPKTMMSKKVRGIFWAGEVVDVDGYTGGYNLQAAFSMGHAAGTGAALFLNSVE